MIHYEYHSYRSCNPIVMCYPRHSTEVVELDLCTRNSTICDHIEHSHCVIVGGATSSCSCLIGYITGENDTCTSQ